ncbi:MAG: hypothetical protein ACRDH2_15415, partial [Anaerolineales bacterium]
HILPIERPAIAVNDPGAVGVAWLEMAHDFTSATVWYARSADGGRTFAPGQLVSTERNGETTMEAGRLNPWRR